MVAALKVLEDKIAGEDGKTEIINLQLIFSSRLAGKKILLRQPLVERTGSDSYRIEPVTPTLSK